MNNRKKNKSDRDKMVSPEDKQPSDRKPSKLLALGMAPYEGYISSTSFPSPSVEDSDGSICQDTNKLMPPLFDEPLKRSKPPFGYEPLESPSLSNSSGVSLTALPTVIKRPSVLKRAKEALRSPAEKKRQEKLAEDKARKKQIEEIIKSPVTALAPNFDGESPLDMVERFNFIKEAESANLAPDEDGKASKVSKLTGHHAALQRSKTLAALPPVVRPDSSHSAKNRLSNSRFDTGKQSNTSLKSDFGIKIVVDRSPFPPRSTSLVNLLRRSSGAALPAITKKCNHTIAGNDSPFLPDEESTPKFHMAPVTDASGTTKLTPVPVTGLQERSAVVPSAAPLATSVEGSHGSKFQQRSFMLPRLKRSMTVSHSSCAGTNLAERVRKDSIEQLDRTMLSRRAHLGIEGADYGETPGPKRMQNGKDGVSDGNCHGSRQRSESSITSSGAVAANLKNNERKHTLDCRRHTLSQPLMTSANHERSNDANHWMSGKASQCSAKAGAVPNLRIVTSFSAAEEAGPSPADSPWLQPLRLNPPETQQQRVSSGPPPNSPHVKVYRILSDDSRIYSSTPPLPSPQERAREAEMQRRPPNFRRPNDEIKDEEKNGNGKLTGIVENDEDADDEGDGDH